MKPETYWKNFKLGEELSISGNFIYDGVRGFHELSHFEHSDELFNVLYNLSVGLERLLKVAVVLCNHEEGLEQEAFEKTLITHTHLELLKRLNEKEDVSLCKVHNDFLALLGRFYKSIRYSRFTLSSVYDGKQEKIEICRFLNKYLDAGIDYESNGMFNGIPNEDKYRKFLRKVVIKISSAIYQIVCNHASKSNIYTSELRSGSKAETVFHSQVNISDEDILWKELLVFLMNTKGESGYMSFLRGIEPLSFDPALVDEYLECFKSDAAKAGVMDELEHLYSELENVKERMKMMQVIGSPGVYFDEDEDFEDDEDFWEDN